jgi:hypothetical protein
MGKVSAKQIKEGISTLKTVPLIVDLERLQQKCPLRFLLNPRRQKHNPFDPGYVVSAFVAKSKGVDLSTISFVLAGSALNFLSRTDPDPSKRYIVQRHCNMMFVAKHKNYKQDYSAPGFQFERLVTGGQFNDKHDTIAHEHLQVVTVGAHRILFSAEVDAAETLQDGTLSFVEIKSSNATDLKNKVALQMVSNSSLSVVQGTKQNSALVGIEKRRLADVFDAGTTSWKAAESHILAGLSQLSYLSHTMKAGKAYEIISCRGGELKILPKTNMPKILPGIEVVEKLLGF